MIPEDIIVVIADRSNGFKLLKHCKISIHKIALNAEYIYRFSILSISILVIGQFACYFSSGEGGKYKNGISSIDLAVHDK